MDSGLVLIVDKDKDCYKEFYRWYMKNKDPRYSKVFTINPADYPTLQDFLRKVRPPKRDRSWYDAVFCQQGANYWLDEKSVKLVARVLAEGGVFVFNTFNRRPPKHPAVREYKYYDHGDAVKYVEMYWCGDDDIVHHYQVCTGQSVDYQQFRWIAPKRIREILTPYFRVKAIRIGGSTYYRCTRKSRKKK